VLGLIAALSLPSIFNAVKTQRDKAVFKEAFNAIQNATYNAKMNGETRVSDIVTYVNSSKTCATRFDTEGCFTVLGSNRAIDAGVMLSTGAVWVDLDIYVHDSWTILDINGNEGPNTDGIDRFSIQVNIGDTDYSNGGVTSRPGEANCSNASGVTGYTQCLAMFK
jgi:type II secretory pathway pseudopilin PulG